MVRPDTIVNRKARSLNRTRARAMRHTPAVTEKHVWTELRDRKLGGYKFRRQYLIGSYIVDFVCVEARLIVELDGVLHADRGDYDRRRDEYLQDQGYRVMRFRNEEFLDDIGLALLTILNALDTPSPRPSPPRCGGEGEDGDGL